MNKRGSKQGSKPPPGRVIAWWPALLFLAIISVAGFGSPRAVGAQGTPTPNVNTVPRLQSTLTPTPAPPPVVVPIVTSTPSERGQDGPNATDGGGADNGDQSTGGGPTNTGAPGAAVTGDSGLPPVLAPTTTTDTVGPALVLSLVPHRGFVWQGQSLQVDWILRNRGDQPATNVRLWGLLPTALQFAALTLDGGAASPPGLVEAQPERAKAGSVALFWPAIAPGAQVTATVTVTIAPDTANGVFIDLVALAEAAESGRTVGGISIAMPPTRLPIFR
ncbi:MAG: hypothetical protein R2867_17100 [Caldilineaceae bacterium]